MTQPQPFQDIADNLSFLDDWDDRYRYLIELGQGLPRPSPIAGGHGCGMGHCSSQGDSLRRIRGGKDTVVRVTVAVLVVMIMRMVMVMMLMIVIMVMVVVVMMLVLVVMRVVMAGLNQP